MKHNGLFPVLLIAMWLGYLPGKAGGAEAVLVQAGKELVEQLLKKGGQQAARELAEAGGESVAREAVEKAAQEGGQQLVDKLASVTIEHGPTVLRLARNSPGKFLTAFDSLEPGLRQAAVQAIRREPVLMERLFADYGRDVLVAAARHPGVGTRIAEQLGREGAELAGRLTTDQAIQLSRLAPAVARTAPPQRSALLDLIGKAPAKVLDLLEQHPKVLVSAASLGAFLAAKDQILGKDEVVLGDDGKPVSLHHGGLVGGLTRQFHTPLTGLITVAGVALSLWAAIKLWAALRISRLKVAAAQSRLSQAEEAAKRPK